MKKGIEIVVFVSGAVLMALEIAGGRLLSFEFGGSVFVWGAIIAVVLSGLSLGYYFGGKLADKKPKEEVLSLLILISALLILLIPLFYSRLAFWMGSFSLVFSPLIIVFSLFFLPSVLLGGVSPFAIKLRVKNIKRVGNVSGNLYALATLGSVVGTFLSVFVLILFIPINQIFVLLSASLMAVVFVLKKYKEFFVYCLLVLFIVTLHFSNASSEPSSDDVVDYVFESLYGPVRVLDDEDTRDMFISNGIMGSIYVDDKFKLVPGWEYLELMIDVSVFLEAKDVLVLGVGAGKIPTALSETYGMKVDAVDINNVVLEVAVKYFGMTPSRNLKLHAIDARVYLKSTDKKYDVIAMDVFKFINEVYVIPPHVTTVEYFELLKDHLNEGGVLMIMIVEEGTFFDSEYKTIESVFEYVYLFDDDLKVLVASDREIVFDEEIRERLVPYSSSDDGLIYTDDYAPIREV